MLRWLLTIAASLALSQAAQPVEPSEFHIVSVFFSDNGAQFYYRVVEARQDGSDSVIRYARIATARVPCPRLIVQAAETRVRDKSPAQLVRDNNPCAVNPSTLRAALNRYRQKNGVFETISFGIVAQCGPSSVVLPLPHTEAVNFEKLKLSDQGMARLWDLNSEITDSVFGPHDIFHDRDDADDLALQLAGEKIVPELISGRYDDALAAAFKGNVGSWKHPTFRALLTAYKGPITGGRDNAKFVPQLLNATAYRFSHFVAPIYPPLARAARIEGKVELQLDVSTATGQVLRASAVSGHPLLTPSAINAAERWSFEAHSISTATVNLVMEYSLRCQ